MVGVAILTVALACGCDDDGEGGAMDTLLADGDAAETQPADGDATGSDTDDVEGDAADGDADVSLDELARETVGSDGATIVVDGFTLTIPAGALSAPVEIVISRVSSGPVGYELYSPVFRLEPSGLQFALPATASIRIEGNANLASVFWSRAQGTGYERLGGTVSGDEVSAQVTHFSDGFAANGVDFDDPADPACGVVTRVLGGGPTLDDPAAPGAYSAVGAVVGVEDCLGRPVRGLTVDDFVLLEDGSPLSTESFGVTLVPTEVAVRGFVTLALDMSVSTQPIRAEMLAAAREFVRQIQETRALPVYIGLVAFAGDEEVEWSIEPTLDTGALYQAIDDLATFEPFDPLATNLYGAVAFALGGNAGAAAAFRSRNHGGAFALGTVIVFSDGRDTAGFGGDTTGTVWVVPYVTDDYDEAAVLALAGGPENVFPVQGEEPSTLPAHFAYVANLFASKIDGATYVLAFCSAARTGTHTLTLQVEAGIDHPDSQWGTLDFDASNFGPGCTADFFTSVCEGYECGGFACGACDDRAAWCDGRRCVDYCLSEDVCDGSTIETPLGYEIVCDSTAQHMDCGGRCVDTRSDAYSCGSCETSCGGVDLCVGGACACRPGYADCDGDPADGCETFLAGASDCSACGPECCDVAERSCRFRAEAVFHLARGGCVRYADGRIRCNTARSGAMFQIYDEREVFDNVPLDEIAQAESYDHPRQIRTCIRYHDGRVACAPDTQTDLDPLFFVDRYDHITGPIGLNTRGRIRCLHAGDECTGLDGFDDFVAVASTHPQSQDALNCGLRETGEVVCNSCSFTDFSGSDVRCVALSWPAFTAQTFSAIAAGHRTMLGLTTAGTLVAWSAATTPADLSGAGAGWVEIAANGNNLCARRADGSATCFTDEEGAADRGQPPAGVLFESLGSSARNAIDGVCGVDTTNTPHCWAMTSQGSISRNPLAFNRILLPHQTLDVVDVTTDNGVNPARIFVLLRDGSVAQVTPDGVVSVDPGPFVEIARSWGRKADGSLVGLAGQGTSSESILDLALLGGSPIALTADGTRVIHPPSTLWFDLTDGPYVRLISEETEAPCAQRADGVVSCWGASVGSAMFLDFAQGRQGISGSADTDWCGVTTAGELLCGDDETPSPPTLLTPPPGNDFAEVVWAGNAYCARRVAGEVVCWGPQPPALKGRFVEVRAFEYAGTEGGVAWTVCGIGVDGRIRCTHHSPPAKAGFVSFGGGALRSTDDGNVRCAIHDTDGLHCWSGTGLPLLGFD